MRIKHNPARAVRVICREARTGKSSSFTVEDAEPKALRDKLRRYIERENGR